MNEGNIRKELKRITDPTFGVKLQNQIKTIADLKNKYNHSIEVLEEVAEGPANFTESDEKTYFNCFMYCFDMNYGDIKDIIGSDGHKLPDSDYVAYLEKEYLTEKDCKEARDGDHILYFEKDRIKHAGRFFGGKVISKWGRGHVYVHDKFEVPPSYGDRVKCFEKVEKWLCLRAYEAWLKKKIYI